MIWGRDLIYFFPHGLLTFPESFTESFILPTVIYNVAALKKQVSMYKEAYFLAFYSFYWFVVYSYVSFIKIWFLHDESYIIIIINFRISLANLEYFFSNKSLKNYFSFKSPFDL